MRPRFVLTLAGISTLYFVAGKIGLSLAIEHASATAVQPAAGVAVAALLITGVRAWPAVALGAFLVNITTSGHLWSSIAIAAGNTLECVIAVALVNQFARGRMAFERGPDILRFTLFGALLAPVFGATIGTAALVTAELAAAGDIGRIWLTWWLGDAAGIVIVAPVGVLWVVPQVALRGGRAEGLLLAASLMVLLGLVFGDHSWAGFHDLPVVVLMVPVLLWSAFRFGPRLTATLTVITAMIAVHRTLHQFGPFSLGEPRESLLVAQSFVGLLAVLTLSVAAEASARRRFEGDIRALNETLERRVAERTEELTRMHDRLVEAQAVAHVGSWEWDVAADTLWWSDEMCRVFGLAEAPTDYARYLAYVHPDDRERTDAQVRQAAAERGAFAFDHRIVRPDGAVRVLHARGRVEVDAAGRPRRMLGIGYDVTDRRRAEDERVRFLHEQAARREAEDANRAKDAFLATLSHELRTPLNAALGWAHILRDSLRVEGRSARALDAIYRNMLIQSRLVSDILDVSRITKGALTLDRDAVDLQAVVAAAIEVVADAAAARGVTIHVEAGGEAIVTGDTRRLQQVAWNLLSNAVKFAAPQGRVTVSVLSGPDSVELAIDDDGPGIAPDFLPHVFEQFRQADESLTREHGGLGLGLAIAHHIVALHHGTIEARNRDGGGASFVVRLPRDLGTITGAQAVASPASSVSRES